MPFDDPHCMPRTGETPAMCYARARLLAGTPGAAYVARRGIDRTVADACGLRYLDDCNGRPAVVTLLRDSDGEPAQLHARYLDTARGQNKMLTVGRAAGVVDVLDGRRTDPLIVVEGLFDALSLAVCGRACVATIGRWAPWLADAAAGRVVWLAFDGNGPGDDGARRAAASLPHATVHRLRPPRLCKDWNTALVRRGAHVVARWLRETVDGERSAPSALSHK